MSETNKTGKSAPTPQERFCVLIPVFNDWQAAGILLTELDQVLGGAGVDANVLLIDDGSTESTSFSTDGLSNLRSVHVLHLLRNVGHQRAIAIGLQHLAEQTDQRHVVVMDADGQDAPADVLRLIEAAHANSFSRTVFAQRLRRSESIGFVAMYHAYRLVHWVLTGRVVKVGNFSLIPASAVRRLVAVSELWNHYSASVFKARLPVDHVPLARAPRILGESKMNFTSLVVHGLSALSVEGERVGVRLVTASALAGSVIAVLAAFGLAMILIGAWIAPAAFWWALLIACVVVFNSMFAALLFTFGILASRNTSSFLVARDAPLLVNRCVQVWPK